MADIQGLIQLMQLAGQNQLKTIEAAKKPQGIPMSARNGTFGMRGAGGLATRDRWEQEARNRTSAQMTDQLAQNKMRLENMTDQLNLNAMREVMPKTTQGPTMTEQFAAMFGGPKTPSNLVSTYDSSKGISPGGMNSATNRPFNAGADPKKTKPMNVGDLFRHRMDSLELQKRLDAAGQNTMSYNPSSGRQPQNYTGGNGGGVGDAMSNLASMFGGGASVMGDVANQMFNPAQGGLAQFLPAMMEMFQNLPNGATQNLPAQPVQVNGNVAQPMVTQPSVTQEAARPTYTGMFPGNDPLDPGFLSGFFDWLSGFGNSFEKNVPKKTPKELRDLL